jgi:transcriptional regulator with XRE-family HTH domain
MDMSEEASGGQFCAASEDLPTGPMALRMMMGAQLRRLREARGISRYAAGEAIRASHSKISRLELGRTGFKQRDLADLLTLYGVDDETERAHWLDLAKQTNTPGWWREYSDIMPAGFEHYLGLEQAATIIRGYEVQFIPDLLQTTRYARAAIRLAHPFAPAAEVERRIRMQAKRQRVLCRPRPPRLWIVIDEAALRRRLGGGATMRHQLRHLIQVTEYPHVTIQVMRFSAGHAAVGGPITILRFSDLELPDVVYLEQLTSALCLERPADVVQYQLAMDCLGVQAEPPAETVPILHEIYHET